MPLKVMDLVELRLRVLADVQDGMSVRDAAVRHGTSKSQVYEWQARYAAEGAAGLLPRSRRPVRSPAQLDAAVEEEIVRRRKDRPRWGAKKIRAAMLRDGSPAPAVSTVHQVLVRRGLLVPRSAPTEPAQGWQRFVRDVPNDLWHIDATRHVLRNGRAFWVIDLIDDHSRYLLTTHVCPSPTGPAGWAAVRLTVGRVGLPRQLLSDNGLNFTGRLHGVVVAFERQVRAAGIDLIHARPYHPQTLGKLERQHATQNAWLADHGRPRGLTDAQQLLEAYRQDYNHVRPHEGIGQAVPADLYRPDAPVQLPALEVEPADPYPAGCSMRLVAADGSIKYSYRSLRLDTRWAGVSVGLLRQHGQLHVFYGSSRIATFIVGDLPQPRPGRRPTLTTP
jgi:transposase InsO family protein